MSARIIHGTCEHILPTLDADSIDAIVTDPPYGIGFMGREWDTFTPEVVAELHERRNRKGTERRRDLWPTKGGMNQGGGVAVQYDERVAGQRRFQRWCESWAGELLRVAKPGAHLVVFGGPRTYHRLTCGLEDAGWEIRDCLMWLFGGGYPKSWNLRRAVAAGTLPDEWNGWGSAIKPGYEPIVLARKPLSERTIYQNVARWGTGALNITGSLIGTGDGDTRVGEASRDRRYGISGKTPLTLTPGPRGGGANGRWPANVILSHSLFCDDDGCADDCPVAMLDDQSGELTSGANPTKRSITTFRYVYGDFPGRGPSDVRRAADRGGASRFFLNAWPDHACLLCAHSYSPKHNTMNATNGVASCESVNTAAASLSLSVQTPGSVPGRVQDLLLRDSEGKRDVSSVSVLAAALPSPSLLETIDDTALPSARESLAELLVPRVKSAASLCDSCATVTAQSLAAMLRDQTPELPHGRDSMPDFSANILIHSLASFAEPLVNTGIIPTTASLSILFGCVAHAIGASIRQAETERTTETAPTRFLYQSKASRAERNAGLEALPELPLFWSAGTKNPGSFQSPGTHKAARNHHPTVKPLALMSYLVRLVTPPGGVVLDPFAGSGTTALACIDEGFDCVLIEKEPEYIPIIEARIEHRRGLAGRVGVEAAD